ncbi:HNH endonuclease [Pseudomonas viridiflava]|uniref:HNH endonuclease n=1 Tax=Pseudomonas viridiflava TaxID=33069 RepID=UPI001783DA02|nr:HNH endonuclease [Pseudomonas viridiflava]MBD8189305.1 HNH endonuclease [Pseudomonas viridiflava]
MRYWWVNHKQSSKYEVPGNFLWSPARKANGHINGFYENMRVASPGDFVISYSHAKIKYVGIVMSFAVPAPKPVVFRNVGENWNKNNGWLLPVFWQPLSEVVVPKQKIEELRKVLPVKHSPINPKTGNGNQAVYLAEVDKPVFESLVAEVFSLLNFNLNLVDGGSRVLEGLDDSIEREILKDKSLNDTVKKRLVDSRVGQGFFKAQVYGFEKSCRLTGVDTLSILIASHIKPWRLCDSAHERLDGANGLLLTPHVDFLFDRGLISFADDGSVLVSSRLNVVDIQKLGIAHACLQKGKTFHSDQLGYLRFHREFIFL